MVMIFNFMLYFTKYAENNTRRNKWKKIIDFTKTNKDGVDIKEILSRL